MQLSIDFGRELVIDLFAGGGGASLGIEWAIGRVDIAVNHDPEAVAMHQANHPKTKHFCESVFRVNPLDVAGHRQVGLLWASPDCTHHSKAKGGKPISKKIRGMAWVVVKWARRLRPRVIMLENVEEFEDWGPVTKDGKPCPLRKGQQFQEFVRQLQRIGYQTEWRLLRACDYGAPTIRRRLFMICRRDGLPIQWPQPTHGDPSSKGVQQERLRPWRAAAECIDWSIPCQSIFERKRPLAENTLRRIARGIERFVLNDPQPFIVTCNHGGNVFRGQDITEPMRTITASRDAHGLVIPVTDKGRSALVAAFLAKHYGGNYKGAGTDLRQPMSTVTARDHHAQVCVHLLNLKGLDRRMRQINQPAPTICAGGNHAALVAALMAPYYGSGSGTTGRDLREPAPTVTSRDRFQLITVTVDGQDYVLTDIGMRMLQPRELYRAQGFPDSYIIDSGPNGRRLSKTSQVRMCGNSVCPQVAAAIVSENFKHEQQLRSA